jgi:hypothetical protein
MKSGSRACFSVWGRPENTLQFTVVEMANERLGRPALPTPAHSNFHLNGKIDEVKHEFFKAGFKGLKVWYQPSNWYFKDG